MIELLKRVAREEKGATAVEYGLILALVFLAMLGAVQTFGQSTTAMWSNTSNTIDAATNKPTP